MRAIKLTQGLEAVVDDDDFGWLSQWKWFAHRNNRVRVYAMRMSPRVDGQQRGIHMHRMILGVQDDKQTDHIDGNGLNNVRSNLRVVTNAQNSRNRRPNLGKEFKGVSHDQGSGKVWRASIRVDGVKTTIGRFHTATEAALAYDVEARKRFGPFAWLNFPDGPRT